MGVSGEDTIRSEARGAPTSRLRPVGSDSPHYTRGLALPVESFHHHLLQLRRLGGSLLRRCCGNRNGSCLNRGSGRGRNRLERCPRLPCRRGRSRFLPPSSPRRRHNSQAHAHQEHRSHRHPPRPWPPAQPWPPHRRHPRAFIRLEKPRQVDRQVSGRTIPLRWVGPQAPLHDRPQCRRHVVELLPAGNLPPHRPLQ